MDPKSRSELFNPHRDEAASGFPIDPPRPAQVSSEMSKDHLQNPPDRVSHSGPLAPGVSWTMSGRKNDDISIVSTRNSLSTGLVASRGLLSVESRDKLVSSHVEATNQVGRFSESFGDPMRNQDRRRLAQMVPGSQQAHYGRIKVSFIKKNSQLGVLVC